MTTYQDVLGVVLAGGLSRRMGQDKAWLEIDDEALVCQTASRLKSQCSKVVVSTNGDISRFQSLGLSVVTDPYPDFRGPMAGILAAMDWAANQQPSAQWVASIAVDTPFFPDNFVSKLHEACRENSLNIAAASSGGRSHPVNALWALSLRSQIRQYLSGKPGKVSLWMEQNGARFVEWGTEPFDPFTNINTPQDLEEARLLTSRFYKLGRK